MSKNTKTDYDKVKLRTANVGDTELEEKHIQPVAKGRIEKPGVGKWFSNVLFGEEGFRGAATHMVQEVIVPSIQNTVADVLVTAVQRAIFGDDYIHRRANVGSFWGRGNNVTRMDTYRGKQIDYTKNFAHRNTRASNIVNDIAFETRQEAQEVFNVLLANLNQYDVVTVGDYYELTDNAASFTDHSYGWSVSTGGLNGARIVAARGGGYKIQFPQPVEV